MSALTKWLMVAIVILLAAVAGWITFAKSEGKATITIDTQEAKKDTQEVIEKGKDLLDEAKESTQELMEDPSHSAKSADQSTSDN